MRLNESYSTIRSQNFLMSPLSLVNQASFMLIQEERQRHNVGKISLVSKPTTLYFGAPNQPVQSRKRFNGVCDYCHIKDHKKETCYKLIGYPADFKFTKKRGTSANSTVTIDTSSDSISTGSVHSSSSSSSQVPVFTPKQYQQILELLGKGSEVQPLAHMVGTSLGPSSQDWILDTGVTNHMTFNLEYLNSLAECDSPSFVQLPNGKTAIIAHVGTYSLTPTQTLSKVLHVPDFHFNLLSVSQLTKELNSCVLFYPHFCLIQDLYSGKMKRIGRVKGSPYSFHSPKFSSSQDRSTQPLFFNSNFNLCLSSSSLQNIPNSSVLWHARLGYSSLSTMNKMSQLDCNLINCDHVKHCSVCPLAKQSRLPFPISYTREEQPFSLIHIDLWGCISCINT